MIKYNFKDYCQIERWCSYWHQINVILDLEPENILEIGVGDKVFSSYLKNNTAIIYKSVDIDEKLNPDIVGSVEKLNFDDKTFDVVCAFEVLEHLPFDKFDQCLRELARVSKKYAVISLPHWGRHFSLAFYLPFFKKVTWQIKINFFPIKHKFDGHHFWEIGKKGYSLKKVKEIIRQRFSIKKDFIPSEMPYHHFFILEKK